MAKLGEEIAGFVFVTPANEVGYSIDKYFKRGELPFRFDQELYETRILTGSKSWRNSRVAALLMYAALRYIQSVGGKTVVGMGRLEVLEMYKHAGFRSLKKQICAGKVTFELIVADVEEDRSQFMPLIADLEKHSGLQIDVKSLRTIWRPCAYLCAPAPMIEELSPPFPPWAVSLPGQIAACEPLKSIAYYEDKWQKKHKLRQDLYLDLQKLIWEIIPGCANFLLCRLPPDQPIGC